MTGMISVMAGTPGKDGLSRTAEDERRSVRKDKRNRYWHYLALTIE
jgi:hypothetical protein